MGSKLNWRRSIVILTDTPPMSELQAEVAHLREELQMRDQLVQQLSQELFRLVKTNTNQTYSADAPEQYEGEIHALREQLQGVEQQVDFYQEQITSRDSELYQLRQSVQELSDRSRMLEQVVQELPRIYKEKFEQRLTPVREKVVKVQHENRRLHAELQSVSYRLAVRNRKTNELDLPSFPRVASLAESLPSLGGI
jgi:chromosome segregation ATPase